MNECQEQKKKGGCGKKIAVGCFTLILLAGVGGFFAYQSFMKLASKLTEEYTATAPAHLPSVEVSDQEASEIISRVDAFAHAVKEGQTGSDLTLSSRDINVLILKKPSWSSMAGKVYVTLESDRIHGDASIPLEKFGGVFKGRWLNGAATFRVETAAGRLLVFLDALSVRGKPIPENFMAGMRNKNLAEEAAKKPENAALIEKLDSVTVRDGKLRIKSK